MTLEQPGRHRPVEQRRRADADERSGARVGMAKTFARELYAEGKQKRRDERQRHRRVGVRADIH